MKDTLLPHSFQNRSSGISSGVGILTTGDLTESSRTGLFSTVAFDDEICQIPAGMNVIMFENNYSNT